MRIAIAGNPNAGKTTVFNALTGLRARVGNYPGVTVERREGPCSLPCGGAKVLDLPGCYSLTARSAEEEIAHDVLVGWVAGSIPDMVLCVVDACQLARGLYLTLQLMEMGLPMVVAVNQIDAARARGIGLQLDVLEGRLGVPVVAVSARTGEGLERLRAALCVPAVASSDAHNVLAPYDVESLDVVRQAVAASGSGQRRDPERVTMGHCLWLLCSDLDAVQTKVPAAVHAVVSEQQSRLNAEGEGSFNRRIIANRYRAVDAILADVVAQREGSRRTKGDGDTATTRIDRVLLHPVVGPLTFVALMFGLFQSVFTGAEPLVRGVEVGIAWAAEFLTHRMPPGHTQSMLLHGVLAGVGNVLAFLPQIALLFFGLTLLEDTGYTARAALLLDRLMGRVGLHGKAFIPLLTSFGCAVPGIMAARTVESRRDRFITILVAPFMSCSARLPVYTLVVAAAFSGKQRLWGIFSLGGVVVFSMYALGFAAALLTIALLKRTVLHTPRLPLLMELPSYRVPLLRAVAGRVWERCRVFVVQTGPMILALSVVLWALMTFPQRDMPSTTESTAASASQVYAPHVAGLAPPEELDSDDMLDRRARAHRLEHSFAGQMGHALEPIIAPLGFDWRIGIGLIASFAAREVLVSTLGQVYALDADTPADAPSLRQALQRDIDPLTGRPRFTPLTGVALMVFFVLALQCMSTVATVARETNSWRWPLVQLVYMNGLAYGVTLVVYQGGRALGWGV